MLKAVFADIKDLYFGFQQNNTQQYFSFTIDWRYS